MEIYLDSIKSLIDLQTLTRLTSLHILIPRGSILPFAWENELFWLHNLRISLINFVRHAREYWCFHITERVYYMLGLWIYKLRNKASLSNWSLRLGEHNPNLVNKGFNELKCVWINNRKKMKCMLNIAVERKLWLKDTLYPNFLKIRHGQFAAG